MIRNKYLNYILTHAQRIPAAGYLVKKIMTDRKLRILLITSFVLLKAITFIMILIPVIKRNL